MSSYFIQAQRRILLSLALSPIAVFAQFPLGAAAVAAQPPFSPAGAILPDAPVSQQPPAAMPPSTGIDAKIDSIGKIKIGPRFDPKALNASDAGRPLSAKGKILLSFDE